MAQVSSEKVWWGLVAVLALGLVFWLSVTATYGGTIGVKPVFDPGASISDAVKLRYHMRVNNITADTLKLIFQTRRLYNPSCSGPNCQTYLLESNLYTYWVQYDDTGCVPWPPTNAGPSHFGQAALWLSIPDYNQKGMVGSRPGDVASRLMFPRVMTAIDDIPGLTKIETMSQMDIAGQDITIEYARGSTFTTPLSGWGWRFDPNSTVSSGQPPCVPDLPAGVVYRIWTSTVTIGGQMYSYEFAVPDQYATHLAPYEIFSIVTEFLDKTSTEISQGKGDFQVYFWDFEVQRENSTTWIPLRKMKVFYRTDPTDNIGWGAKIGVYTGRPVLEISNDTTDTYYKLGDVFEIAAAQPLAGLTSTGQIYYTPNLTSWINIPGQLSQLQVGDLNDDGQADLAGLASDGIIWYTTNRSTWTRIPGGLVQLRIGDLNDDGQADLAGLASNGSIWYTTNLHDWINVPGQLAQLRVGDFNGDGKADLVGLAGSGTIWYTTNGTWTQVPGQLAQLRVGDFNGDGHADLAGLASNGSIWYTTNLHDWVNVPGQLAQLRVGDFNGDGKADLAGLAGNGTIWYTTNFSTWSQIPGGLNRLVVGDFNNDGRDDLAGLAGAGSIWYTTNRATWTNIPGQLNRLAGDD